MAVKWPMAPSTPAQSGPASRYLPRVLPGKQPPPPKRGSVLWRALKKGVPMFLGRRRRIHRPRPPRFLIDPDARLKGIWVLLLAGCVFYTTCVVPYRVCFQREAEGASPCSRPAWTPRSSSTSCSTS